MNNILRFSDSGKSTVVIFGDLTTAFNTIDCIILIFCLHTSFRISDTAVFWLRSYNTSGTYSDCIISPQLFCPLPVFPVLCFRATSFHCSYFTPHSLLHPSRQLQRAPLHCWVLVSITQSLSSVALLTKTFPNFRKLKISWHLPCVFFSTRQSNSDTLLRQLCWLPIEYRVNFKIANITFNTLHYSQPAYIHSL